MIAATVLSLFGWRGWMVGAQATPVPGAQTWHVLVNQVSPPGENWSFGAFYPDHLAAHAGDTVVFTLADNADAFHTVHLLGLGMTPMTWDSGFGGGFLKPNPAEPGAWQRPVFENLAPSPCGRAGQDPCQFVDNPGDIFFGVNSGVLTHPRDGDAGNPTFTITLDPSLRLGPLYFMSDVDGPAMSGRIDIVGADEPVQTAEELAAAADRQYAADLSWLAGHDRVQEPKQSSNPDGTKTWQVSAGGSGPARTDVSINEFGPSQIVVTAGDTVTWTNTGPSAVAHTVSGFATTADALPTDLSPYQPGCQPADGGAVQLPAAGTSPFDIWTDCPGPVLNLTAASEPSSPSGDPYTDGGRTSGILLSQDYLDSPIGEGLPFVSSYSVTFTTPGVYHYACAIHPGMVGTVIVVPKPMPM